MAASAPKIRNVGEIRSALLQPALTSHYECYFVIPGQVNSFIQQAGIREPSIQELLIMSCSEASLPGSNLATHELNNDFTGVTQRHAYRRLYDDRVDFTFYVNNKYSQIMIFERWMQFISGEQINDSFYRNKFYRVKYPTSYKSDIYITKFDRTGKVSAGRSKQSSSSQSSQNYSGEKIYYNFYNAFPISVGSMPISYESSSLLKCTVSFTYDRYTTSKTGTQASKDGPSTPSQPTAVGVPNPSTNFNPTGPITPQTQAAINAGYAGNLNLNLGNISTGTVFNTNSINQSINQPLF